jgi:hypothetical protein
VIGMDADHFSPGQDAPAKKPAGPHALSGHDARKAPSGVASLLVTFLWPCREK